MPTSEWLHRYESVKKRLACAIDLEAYFTEAAIGSMAVDVLDIGSVSIPTGELIACDLLVEL